MHDALLVNCKIEDIDRTVAKVKALMIEASQSVLSGFALKVGHETTKYPDRLTDKRGTKMWAAVMEQMEFECRIPERKVRLWPKRILHLEDLVVLGDAVGMGTKTKPKTREKGHSPRRAFHYDYDLAST